MKAMYLEGLFLSFVQVAAMNSMKEYRATKLNDLRKVRLMLIVPFGVGNE